MLSVIILRGVIVIPSVIKLSDFLLNVAIISVAMQSIKVPK